MSAQIGVLAAIDAAIEGIQGEGYECPDLEDAYGAVAELIQALMLARSELYSLPHSLGYSFTHLPRIDAALARVEGA